MKDDEDLSWLEGGEDVRGRAPEHPAKSENVTKSRLALLLDYAPLTIDRFVKEGMPVESRGSRKLGWRMNLAKCHHWIVGHKVHEATGDPEVASYDSAKRRDKDVSARLKELRYEREAGNLVTIDDVVIDHEARLAVVRTRLFAIPPQVSPDSDVQERVRDLINDALLEICGAFSHDDSEA